MGGLVPSRGSLDPYIILAEVHIVSEPDEYRVDVDCIIFVNPRNLLIEKKFTISEDATLFDHRGTVLDYCPKGESKPILPFLEQIRERFRPVLPTTYGETHAVVVMTSMLKIYTASRLATNVDSAERGKGHNLNRYWLCRYNPGLLVGDNLGGEFHPEWYPQNIDPDKEKIWEMLAILHDIGWHPEITF